MLCPYKSKAALDVVEREGHGSEAALAEQIHFDEPEIFDGVHAALRDDNPFCGAFERRQARQWTRGNHRTAGVNAHVARGVVESQRHLEDGFPGLVVSREVAALRQVANGL